MAVSALRSATGDALQLRFCWSCSSPFGTAKQRLSRSGKQHPVCQQHLLRYSQQAEVAWSTVLQLRFGSGAHKLPALSPRAPSAWRACVHGADGKTGTICAVGSCVAGSQAGMVVQQLSGVSADLDTCCWDWLAGWRIATSGLAAACVGSHELRQLQQQQHGRETCVLCAWWYACPIMLNCISVVLVCAAC